MVFELQDKTRQRKNLKSFFCVFYKIQRKKREFILFQDCRYCKLCGGSYFSIRIYKQFELQPQQRNVMPFLLHSRAGTKHFQTDKLIFEYVDLMRNGIFALQRSTKWTTNGCFETMHFNQTPISIQMARKQREFSPQLDYLVLTTVRIQDFANLRLNVLYHRLNIIYTEEN